MRLITILLLTISVLIVLSGLAVCLGSKKSERVSSTFFFAATIFGALWAVSIATFLALRPDQASLAPLALLGIYSSALFLDTCLVGHAGWRYTFGKISTLLFTLYSLFIVYVLLFHHELLYTEIVLSYEGNRIIFAEGWFGWAYLAFFSLITFVLLGILFYRALQTTNRGQRRGIITLMLGLSFTGIVSLIFDLLLTYWVTYSLIWVGPVTMAVTIIAYYYAIIRYRLISLDADWLKLLSYAIILASAAVLYTLVFFTLFSALFRASTPSFSMYFFNAIMIAIVLLLIPAVREITAFLKSLIITDRLNLAYIIKNLDKLASHPTSLNELAVFLTDHLHFAYIGILKNGKLYGSSALPVSSADLTAISKLKPSAASVWETPSPATKATLSGLGITMVAELRSDSGKPIGQLLFGRPTGKTTLSRRDLIQLEMLVNYSATVVESTSSKKRKK